MAYQASSIDESERLEALLKSGDPLVELDALIDFDTILRPKLENAFAKPEPKEPGGRPFYDVVMIASLSFRCVQTR